MRRNYRPRPDAAVHRLLSEILFGIVGAASLFLLRPVLHKSVSYTTTYAVTWLGLVWAVAAGRFLRSRRQSK